MARRRFPLLTCLVLSPIVSCNKLAAPTMPAPAPCALVSARDVRLDDGTELRTWDLRAVGLHRLTARLIVATDGKAQTAREVEYKWAPGAGSATGQLVLLIQDGKAFGAKGRLPLLALNFPDLPHATKTESSARQVVAGDLHPSMTSATTDAPQLTEQSILYAQLFVPDGTAGGLNCRNVESLVDGSKDARTVVAVVLEWGGP